MKEICMNGKIVFYPLPKNTQKADEKLFTSLQKVRIETLFVYRIENVNVLSNGVLFKNMRVHKHLLLANDQRYLGCPNWKGLLNIYYNYELQKFSKDTTYVLVHNIYSHTYYHWLLEVLPRLYLAKHYLQDAVLLLPQSYQAKFHYQSLNIFGIRKTVSLEENKIYQVSRLVVPSQIGRIANYHPEAIKQTVRYIKQQLDLSTSLDSKIYVSRMKASRRKLLNEEEVKSCLEKYGFVSVCFEDYSFEQQVSIMHNCRHLVGLHGAGLANMIFMPEGGSVLELRKYDKNENYFFYTLSATANHNYYYQFIKSTTDEGYIDDDILVDINLLEKNVKLMLT